jgi:precorrin isomerase
MMFKVLVVALAIAVSHIAAFPADQKVLPPDDIGPVLGISGAQEVREELVDNRVPRMTVQIN